MQPKGRRPEAEPRKQKQTKKPRSKPPNLYGMKFEDVIRRLVSRPPSKKGRV